MDECEVDMITNRVCERGTKNCDQDHPCQAEELKMLRFGKGRHAMKGWEQPIDGESESDRRERLAKAAAHEKSPFDGGGMSDTDRRFIRDALRATRPQEQESWRDRQPML
jgi:hypothetical protein